jgi:hypothetical protein
MLNDDAAGQCALMINDDVAALIAPLMAPVMAVIALMM